MHSGLAPGASLFALLEKDPEQEDAAGWWNRSDRQREKDSASSFPFLFTRRKARALAKYLDFVTGRNGFTTEVISVNDPYPDAVAISQLQGVSEL